MDNGVECDHSGQSSVTKWQRQHVPQLERDAGMPLASFVQQTRRQIQTSHCDPLAVEERGCLAWAAPQVINLSSPYQL
jgi:hypothetical protein